MADRSRIGGGALQERALMPFLLLVVVRGDHPTLASQTLAMSSRRNVHAMPSDEPDERVRTYAADHGRAIATGDSEGANTAHEGVAAIYRELRKERRRDQLLPLLQHADPSVRVWAGVHALELAPKEGERVLRELAEQEPGIIGFNAEQTLSVWRNGELSFP